MIDLDYLSFVIVTTLGILFYFGWPRNNRWARVFLILLVIILLCSALALGLFVYAMGKSNWSL